MKISEFRRYAKNLGWRMSYKQISFAFYEVGFSKYKNSWKYFKEEAVIQGFLFIDKETQIINIYGNFIGSPTVTLTEKGVARLVEYLETNYQ